MFLVDVLLLTGMVFGQTEPAKPKTISGGVLNGKAVSLPKPAYPLAALAVKAGGAISVQVLIDEEGNVVSANAVSGHPLLRAAAVEAALAAKFSPALLEGNPVKISGVLTYNFSTVEGTKPNWFIIANLLASLENAPSLVHYERSLARYTLPTDWNGELQLIRRLSELSRMENDSLNLEKSSETVISDKTIVDKSGSFRSTINSVTTVPGQEPLPEGRAIGQSLISSIRGRLGSEPLELWKFDLGLNLSFVNNGAREKRPSGVKAFREFLQTAPPEIPPAAIKELEKIVNAVERGMFNESDAIAYAESVGMVARMLSNL